MTTDRVHPLRLWIVLLFAATGFACHPPLTDDQVVGESGYVLFNAIGEYRDTRGDLEPLLERAAERLGTSAFTVTRGQHGCVVKGAGERPVAVPSFTPRIVDRVGAGDALFAITSMAAKLGAPTGRMR